MRRVCCFLLVVLVIGMSNAVAACRAKDASQIVMALSRGIDLNERFKRAVKAVDDPKYQDLRKQVERYGEETAMPCVRKAVELLEREPDEALLRKLMDFAVSYENSADETVSEAMATIFAKHPDVVVRMLERFSAARRKIIVRSIDSGWSGVAATLAASERQDKEARLRALRSGQAKRDAVK